VILYSAERAWSHAMEKRQLPNGPNASQRIYLIGRLRKAVKWASLFSQLSAIKADSRTSLEAEVSLLIISIATKARCDDFYSHQMICC
jgi:signal recognition particle subunit SRP68